MKVLKVKREPKSSRQVSYLDIATQNHKDVVQTLSSNVTGRSDNKAGFEADFSISVKHYPFN